MTLEVLEALVEEARAKAVQYASRCAHLVIKGDLVTALEVCKEASIDHPQCSLTATSENAKRLRDAAGRKMSDPAWWKKSLESSAARAYEGEQIAQGKVTNFVSDGLAAYHAKHKRRS
jgi:hypothetical protein